MLTGIPWFTIDQVRPPTPIKFVVDLGGMHLLCGVRVEFPGTSSHVVDWMLYVSETTSEHDVSGLSNFTQVLRVKDESWQDWASQRLANPTSARKRHFPCRSATRARLQLNDTENAIFAIVEVELYGYPVATYGMCPDRCRHGGGCMHRAQRCTCPRKWGWRGSTCDVDVDECSLARDSQIAAERVPTIVHENGGCGQGNPLQANCTNTQGSWECNCRHGFLGANSEGRANVCLDIDECATARGGCEHICLNSVGSYSCGCRSGYETALDSMELDEDLKDDRASWSDEQPEPYEPTRHMVSTLPLLGAVCAPVCDSDCEHGGECVAPNRCAPCDSGWHGPYCEKEVCEVERSYHTEAGELIEDLGCYHGGRCMGIGFDCQNCMGGWTGTACHQAPGGWIALALGGASALLVIPCLVVVAVKRTWLPFQERGVALLLIGGSGALILVLAAPASSNAWVSRPQSHHNLIFGEISERLAVILQWYGLALEPFAKQPESSFWAMWLPGTFGYAVVRPRAISTTTCFSEFV